MSTLRAKLNPNTKLIRLAAYVGVIGSSGLLFMQWITNRRIRKSDMYQKATTELLSYQPTVDLFGPPIYFGNVNFGDKRNINTPTSMRVLIPVRGEKNRGVLYAKATRLLDPDEDVLSSGEVSKEPMTPWRLDQLEVSVDNRPGESARIPLNDPILINFSST